MSDASDVPASQIRTFLLWENSYGIFVAHNGIKYVPIFMKIGQMLQTCTWPYKHREDDGFIILRLLHVIKNRLGIKAIMLWNKHQI